ncbi:MAG: hypothetical protein R6U38_11520 [Desulfatiglandaceae bacterium]
MIFYVYFDSYGHARSVLSRDQLEARYSGDPDAFLRAMNAKEQEAGASHTTGHVGTLRFDTPEALQEYLNTLGDEITGFYDCDADSRPYNF